MVALPHTNVHLNSNRDGFYPKYGTAESLYQHEKKLITQREYQLNPNQSQSCWIQAE
jgi:hypothetical protein